MTEVYASSHYGILRIRWIDNNKTYYRGRHDNLIKKGVLSPEYLRTSDKFIKIIGWTP